MVNQENRLKLMLSNAKLAMQFEQKDAVVEPAAPGAAAQEQQPALF